MSRLAAAEPALRELVEAVRGRGDGARVGVAVVDVPTGDRLTWGSAEPFEAASVIKMPILVAALRAVERGELRLDDPVRVPRDAVVGGSGVLRELSSLDRLSLRDLLTLMIVISDNMATNIVIDELGGVGPVNAMLDELGLRDTRLGRKLMDLAARARGELNVLTADDVAALFTALVRGELLAEAQTREALDVLSRQQVRDRLPLHLPADVRVAHKTGELGGLRHDAGVLYLGPAGDHPVVAVVLTERFADVPHTDVGTGGTAAAVAAEAGRILHAAYR